MKKNLFLFLSVVFCLMAVGVHAAVYMDTDTGVSIAMEEVDYMIRADGTEKFAVVLKNGETVTGVSSVSFSQRQATGNQSPEILQEVRFYPNPVIDHLFVSGLSAGACLQVLSLDGKVVKNIVADSSEVFVSVSDLPQGTYVLKSACNAIKFIKK